MSRNKAWLGWARNTRQAAALLSAIACASVVANTPPQVQDPARTSLPRFAIDTTEVSIAQFAEFVQATGLQTQAEKTGGGFEFLAGWERVAGTSWRYPNRAGESNPNWPAVHITWDEARAYCAWRGGRLPHHSEWLSAAFTEQRAAAPAPFKLGQTYPWPTGPDATGANTSGPDPWPRAAPVGATQPGVNGLYDMGANVWEWTLTARGESRQTVGGSWWYPSYQMQADVKSFKPKDFFAVYIGFRCVYPLPS